MNLAASPTSSFLKSENPKSLFLFSSHADHVLAESAAVAPSSHDCVTGSPATSTIVGVDVDVNASSTHDLLLPQERKES